MVQGALLGIAEDETLVGDANFIAITQAAGAGEAQAVDGDTIAAAEVVEPPLAVEAHEHRMAAGGLDVVDVDVVVRAAADEARAGQGQHPTTPLQTGLGLLLWRLN